jgi:hypothetical protein
MKDIGTRVGYKVLYDLKANIVTTQLEANAFIEATNKYLSVAIGMVVIDPYEAKALMHFNAILFLNELSSKQHSLIDTTISFNFMGKELFMANCLYKDGKTAPMLAIRVASASV